jgi:hypothetical protein
MIEGRFGDTSGRPYIESRLAIPRLRKFGDISFILDTGADTTLLMPLDGGRIGIDYNMLQGTASATGIGGLSKHYVEPAILAFTDPGKCLYAYTISLRIASPSPDIGDIPSLLGRDVLDNWLITIDRQNDLLTAEVLVSEVQIPIK